MFGCDWQHAMDEETMNPLPLLQESFPMKHSTESSCPMETTFCFDIMRMINYISFFLCMLSIK